MCLLAVYHPDLLSGHFAQVVVFSWVDNTYIIYLLKLAYYQPLIRIGYAWHTIAEVVKELLYLGMFYVLVAIVIGLEAVINRVALGLQGFVGLKHGKIELRNELAIHPRLAHVIVKHLAFGSG